MEVYTINDYCIKKVKRKKSANCKYCEKDIDIGNYAEVISSINKYFDSVNIIGITHLECTNEFIENNIKLNNNE
jgi:hypothetical protein